MRLWQLLFSILILMMLTGIQPAGAQTTDPWIFSPPPGAVRSADSKNVTYTIGREKYILGAPFDGTGMTLSGAVDQFVSGLFPNGSAKIVDRTELGDGRFFYTTAVQENNIFALFFEKSGNSIGAIVYITTRDLLEKPKLYRLMQARLRTSGAQPPAATVSTPAAVSMPPRVNANWPKGGLVPSTIAQIDWQAAWKMGLDPENNILPVTYDCFQSEKARSVSPNADGVLNVQSGRRYSYASDKVSGSGSWNIDPERDYPAYQFTGVLRGEGFRNASVVQDNEHGQYFEILERNDDEDVKDRKLACFQRGPSSEAARIKMARGLLGQETMKCVLKSGSVVMFQFGNQTYSSPSGSGRFKDYLVSRSRAEWEGVIDFSGGPFKDALGYLSEDDQGNRTMDVAIHTTIEAYLTSVREKEPVANCYGKSVAKPLPIYGNAAVPATGMTGGFSGTYLAVGSVMNGLIQLQTLDVYTFTPNGWYYVGAPRGAPINCSRTKPSGAPSCLRYEISGAQIRQQDNPGTWKNVKWEPWRRLGATINIDGRDYTPMRPMTGVKLAGTYKMQSSYSSGTVTGVLATSISEGTIIFTADGQFKSSKSTWSRIGIGIGTAAAPSAITGSASNFDANNAVGKYRIDGNWLILTRNDGAEIRQFIYTSNANLMPGKSPGLIYINEEDYFRQ
jgi:hypothetical protein